MSDPIGNYFTLENGPWPAGTTVAVWSADDVVGGVPVGAEIDSSVAGPDGTVTFGGLTLDEQYTAFGHGGTQTFEAGLGDDARLDAAEDDIATRAKIANLPLNVKDEPWLAPGDGTSHPLSQRFATLAEAQAVFPVATALTDEQDWAAHQTVLNLTKTAPYGNHVHSPKGSYRLNRSLDLSGLYGVVWTGVSEPDPISSHWGTKLMMTGTQDLLVNTTAASFTNVTIRDMCLRSLPGGGHVHNMARGSRCVFRNIVYVQENAAKSGLYWDATNPVIECEWVKCHFLHRSDATVPAFSAVGPGGLFNVNQIRRCRFTYSGEYAIHIEATGANSYATDNTIEDVNFEVTNGGCVKLKAAVRTYLRNCAAYDLHIVGSPAAFQPANSPTTRDLFWFGKNANNLRTRKTTVINCGRAGGTLGGGLYDIKLEAGGAVGTVFINAGDPITDFAVDFGSNSATVIGSEDINWAARANATEVRWADRPGGVVAELIGRLDAMSAGQRYIGWAGVVTAGGNAAQGAFYFDPAEHGATMTVRFSAFVNAVAPASDFIVGLFPVTGAIGGTSVVGVNVGAVIAASQVTATAPAAGSVTTAKADFTPPAAGHYIVGINASAAMAASSSLVARVIVETT